MQIEIISVGKKHDTNLSDAIEEYQKRLTSDLKLQWLIIPQSSSTNPEICRQEESKMIINRLDGNSQVILLDERGHQKTSEQFSELIYQSSHQKIKFIIGGAYGVSEELRSQSTHCLSLSKLVFPHMIVRLLLIEQIYRAVKIHQNHPYHHS